MQKFKAIVETSDTIAIRIGETNDISKILAGTLLHQAFLKLNKRVSIDTQDAETASAFFETPLKSFGKEENILIKFDTEKLPVSELRYEKDGKFMKIILKSGNGDGDRAPDLSEIVLEKEALPVDLLMLIDTPETEIENALKENPHKEVVKLGTKDKALSLKVEEIFNAFFEETPQDVKEALWFFIKYEKRMDWDIGGGLREEKILRAKEALFGPSFWRLLGRALARSHFEKEIQTLWAFLPKSDFSAAGGPAFGGENVDAQKNKNSVLKILNELRALRPESRLFALLWEDAPKSISAVIASRDSTMLKNLAVSMSSVPASSYFIANGFSAFSEAEIKIRGLIRRVL